MKLLTIISLFFCGFLNAQVKDTVVIVDTIGVDIHFPTRVCVTPKMKGQKVYLDSIKAGPQGGIINKYMQNYYLIVTNAKGERLLEGDFFDEFACGKMIEYKKPNKKYLEGFFTMTKTQSKTCGGIKEYKSDPSGTWNYYGANGQLIRTMTYDPVKKTTAIKNYDAKGKVVSEEFLKDGKPVTK